MSNMEKIKFGECPTAGLKNKARGWESNILKYTTPDQLHFMIPGPIFPQLMASNIRTPCPIPTGIVVLEC